MPGPARTRSKSPRGGHVADRLTISGLEVFGHHGVHAEERRRGQRFVVDITLELDTLPAAAADDLALSVDYGAVAADVHRAVANDPVDLLETLAERVAELCLLPAPVRRVSVTVHKPEAPLAVAFSDVAVTIERSCP